MTESTSSTSSPAEDGPASEPGWEITSETENLIETYQITAEWIRFADAKAAVVLTVNGALASVLIPTLKPIVDAARTTDTVAHPIIVITLISFVLFIGSAVFSSFSAFRCIIPARENGRHPALDRCRHFHPAAISAHYPMDDIARFQEGFKQGGASGFRDEVLAGLLIDAHISSRKYKYVSTSIKCLGVAAIFGFIYLFLTQV